LQLKVVVRRIEAEEVGRDDGRPQRFQRYPDDLRGPQIVLRKLRRVRARGSLSGTRASAVRMLEAGDPAIQSKRGFRYEVLPMPGAKS
jgi:hypothetical protein